MIFDLKHHYNINGLRIIGWYGNEQEYKLVYFLHSSANQSTPRDGHLDVSNALNGPWLRMKDFTCSLTRKTEKKTSFYIIDLIVVEEKKNDFFFPSFNTRFIRIFILNNHGSDDIRIQGVAFFGVDTRLLNLLKQFGLENSLQTLLANVSHSFVQTATKKFFLTEYQRSRNFA